MIVLVEVIGFVLDLELSETLLALKKKKKKKVSSFWVCLCLEN